jgi:predicted secreted protein
MKNACRLLCLILVLFSGVVQAADGAKFRAIGFSPDGAFFAFEQYGMQDGSGFAYSDIFLLDIAHDAWVKGTPINVVLEEETLSVTAVRAKSKKLSTQLLQQMNISVDAEILAANPFTEVVTERSKLTFHDHYNNAMGVLGNADSAGSWTLTTSLVTVPLPAGCEDDIGVKGYRLDLKNNLTSLKTQLHIDKTVPKSRSCTIDYDIEAVVQPVGNSETGQLVAIIGVASRGFEGADRRFIAVPFKFN